MFKIEKKNLQRVKNTALKDEVVSKASILIKEAKSLGLKETVYYCYISGLEEACKKAEELMKDIGEKVSEENKEKIIKLIKQEEESALTGFGDIFG